MSEQYLSNTVHSSSSGTVGRSLNSVANHHFVIDSPSMGEEITSTDSFLAGLSSCGVNLIEGAARETGVPLRRIDVVIEGLRSPQATARFAQVNMRFTLAGPTQEQAAELVERYKNR
jgi:uncharacterized OsmC-like protein